MGYQIEFNCLLVVPSEKVDITNLKEGAHYSLIKDGERIYPLNIAIEICNENYKYYGKVAIKKLTLSKEKSLVKTNQRYTAAISSNQIRANKKTPFPRPQ